MVSLEQYKTELNYYKNKDALENEKEIKYPKLPDLSAEAEAAIQKARDSVLNSSKQNNPFKCINGRKSKYIWYKIDYFFKKYYIHYK